MAGSIIISIVCISCAYLLWCIADKRGANTKFWAIMGAVDVAFTEASVGAGVSTVLFVAAVFHTSRRSKD